MPSVSEDESKSQQWLRKVTGITLKCGGIPTLASNIYSLNGDGKEFEDHAKLISRFEDIGERLTSIAEGVGYPKKRVQEFMPKFRDSTITLTPNDVEAFLSAPQIIDRALTAVFKLFVEDELTYENIGLSTPKENQLKYVDAVDYFKGHVSTKVNLLLRSREEIETFNETVLRPALEQRRSQARQN